MDLLSYPWLIALFSFFFGIGAGIYIHRSKYSEKNQTDKLINEMKSMEEELEQYKSSVSDHFSKTSTLVSELTENYVKVYQHLAEGSQTLANTDLSLQLGENGQQLTSAINRIEESSNISQDNADGDTQVPKDYAPKTDDAETESTLSEAFSINTDTDRPLAEGTLEPAEKKLA